MDIEKIINQVRYKSSKDRKSSRGRSAPESTERSVVSETRSAPDLVEHSENLQSNDYTTFESDASQPVASRQHIERDRDSETSQTTSSKLQCRARTISGPQVAAHPTQWPPKPASAPTPSLYEHSPWPVYFPAYMVVPMRIPPHDHYLQPRSSLAQHQQRSKQIIQEDKSTPDPIPRGVRLPPLPESQRRTGTVCKRKPVPAKKRIRAPPVVYDYDHLSIEEAIRELARRDIYITDIQRVSLSKPNLVRLLQRADRNNNKGGSNSPKESAVLNASE